MQEGLAGLSADVRAGFDQVSESLWHLESAMQAGFDALASELYANRQVLSDIRGILDKLLDVTAHPRATEAAELCAKAIANLQAGLKFSGDRRRQLLDKAEQQLRESVEINDEDCGALFHRGCVALWHRQDAREAAEWFGQAVLYSLHRAPEFAVYALRHQALALREAGRSRRVGGERLAPDVRACRLRGGGWRSRRRGTAASGDRG